MRSDERSIERSIDELNGSYPDSVYHGVRSLSNRTLCILLLYSKLNYLHSAQGLVKYQAKGSYSVGLIVKLAPRLGLQQLLCSYMP